MLGRPLAKGDLVILQPGGGHLSYRVEEIVPETDPRFPGNTVRVVLTTVLPMHVTTGGAIPAILIVPQADEEPSVENAQAANNGGPTLVVTDGE